MKLFLISNESMLKNQKELFDIPNEVNYLNIANQSPSFKAVEKAGIEAVIKKSHPYKITTDSYFEPVKELKKLFAKLIEAEDYNRIASIPSASYGLSSVANNISLEKGDEILLLEDQFPSNYYVWEKLATKFQANIKIVMRPTVEVNQGLLWNEAILNNITRKTAVVAIGNVHWACGTLFNLKAIRKKTTQFNSLLIIDGTQSVGALPFSVKEINPDALICAGYKWLFGPYGCGYGYFGKFFDNGIPLEENWSNRMHSEKLSNLTSYEAKYKPLANRYSVGEHASFIHTQMQITALKQVIEWEPAAIQKYCYTITKKAVEDLKEIGCFIENSKDRAHHLFGIRIPENLSIRKLKEELSKANIFVSFRGQYIRISCHVYNTKQDFEALVTCIKTAIN